MKKTKNIATLIAVIMAFSACGNGGTTDAGTSSSANTAAGNDIQATSAVSELMIETSAEAGYEVGDTFTVDGYTYKVVEDGLCLISTDVTIESEKSGFPVSEYTIPAEANGYPLVELAEYALYGLEPHFTRVNIPNGVKRLAENSLTTPSVYSIYLPPTIESTGGQILYGVDNCCVKEVYYNDLQFKTAGLKKTAEIWDTDKVANVTIEEYIKEHSAEITEVFYSSPASTAQETTAADTQAAVEELGDKEYHTPPDDAFTYEYDAVLEGLRITNYNLSRDTVSDNRYIIIPEEINGDPVRSFFGNVNVVRGVILPDTVTVIEDNAFYMANVNSVEDPDNPQAFCEITIPDSVKSIGKYAFSCCRNLSHIKLPSDLEYIGTSAFQHSGITEITIPGSVKMEGQVFWECDELKKAVICDGVTEIPGFAFKACPSLTEVTIPESVTEIGHEAFEGCNSLKAVKIPEGVTEIKEEAFYGCESLEEVILPSGLQKIGRYGFAESKSLKYITLPEGITELVEDSFRNSGLTEITVPASLKNAEKAFNECGFLVKAVISNGTTKICNGIFENCYGLTDVTIPESVTVIGGGAFWKCTSLKSMTIPYGVTTIEGQAFDSCESLEEIVLPDSVKKLGSSVFYKCKSLKTITIPYSVTEIKNAAFSDCTSLKTVILPASITNIESYIFQNCESLEEIVLPDKIQNIGDSAFSGCTSLKSVKLNEGITEIDNNAFARCTNLSDISVPNSVEKIKPNAFKGCDNLKVTYKGKTYTDANIKELYG